VVLLGSRKSSKGTLGARISGLGRFSYMFSFMYDVLCLAITQLHEIPSFYAVFRKHLGFCLEIAWR